MKRFHSAPMLVLSEIPYGEFALEPYEAGWASEAIAFIYIRKFYDSMQSLSIQPQVSADGCRWIDFGPAIGPITAPGSHFIQLKHFGNWIRLAGSAGGDVSDCGPAFVGDFYWAVKE
jgi:hypothetical protein